MTGGSDWRRLTRGVPSAPVFSPQEAAAVAGDVHLRLYLAITTHEAARFLADLGEYAALAPMPFYRLTGSAPAFVGRIAFASHRELVTLWRQRSSLGQRRSELRPIDPTTTN